MRSVVLSVSLALLVTACGAPVRVTRDDPRHVTRELTSSVVTSGKPSLPTENVLHRWNLTSRFARDPEGALAVLHQAVIDGRADARELFAMAELSFKHADDSGKREYYLAAAVYAYAFLFPAGADTPPGRLDPRARIAADVYNRSLTAGFAAADHRTVDLRAATYALPFGRLEVSMPPETFLWNGRGLYHFVPVAELHVHGMKARYRRPGIGAPLAAKAWLDDEPTGADAYVARGTRVPVTAFLRVADPRRQLGTGDLRATLELFDAYETRSLIVDGRTTPLEVEPTATLAWQLSDSPIWSWELRGFLSGDLLSQQRTQLTFLKPYRPGRIPVVFVHGTASSPGRWADMVNDLDADPAVRERFQFWFFFYSSGSPLGYSGAKLRETLAESVRRVDPNGTDPALREMVIVGHSQGGLLTKMAVIDPGDRLWKRFSTTPIDQLTLRPATRKLLEGSMFPRPLPFVRRVVFIATPHRGSYVAAMTLSKLVARFITLPRAVLEAAADVATGNAALVTSARGRIGFGAVMGMVPGSAQIEALAAEPIVPGVHAHSIVAVQGDGEVEDGTDGVVAYSSAHISGVDSEVVIRSSHSCQSHPEAVAEVRRILGVHLSDACTRGVACPGATAAAQTR